MTTLTSEQIATVGVLIQYATTHNYNDSAHIFLHNLKSVHPRFLCFTLRKGASTNHDQEK